MKILSPRIIKQIASGTSVLQAASALPEIHHPRRFWSLRMSGNESPRLSPLGQSLATGRIRNGTAVKCPPPQTLPMPRRLGHQMLMNGGWECDVLSFGGAHLLHPRRLAPESRRGEDARNRRAPGPRTQDNASQALTAPSTPRKVTASAAPRWRTSFTAGMLPMPCASNAPISKPLA